MKTRISLLAALSAFLLPLAVPANVLESLASNPDDVMLRKPAQPPRTEARRADETAAKKAAEEAAATKAAEEAAAKKAAEEAVAKQAAELKRLREEVAAAQAAREQAEAARKAAEERVAAEKAASAKLAEEKAAAEKRAAYLANPDPDERPAAPKRKLQAEGEQKDVTEAVPVQETTQGAKKEKKKLTGRSALITSDRTDYDRKEGVILFDRNVYVDDEQYQMHAERLFVFLDGTNDLKRLVAIGNISITNDTKAAGCARAVYSKADSRIVMYGDDTHPAWLRDAGGKKGDASEISGKRITYWFDSETATVEGAVVKAPAIKGGSKDIFGAASGKSEKNSDGKSEKAE